MQVQNLNCPFKDVLIFLTVNDSQEVKKNFRLITTKIDLHILIFKGTGKLRKSHFAFISQQVATADCEGKLIDDVDNIDNIGQRKSYWQHELDTFRPNGLNKRESLPFYLKLIYHYSSCFLISS